MSVDFELTAKIRSDTGKGASRRLRRENRVPAILYGAGKDSVSLVLEHDDVAYALKNEGYYSHILTVHIGGKAEKAVLKDVQRHPAKPRILHLDLQRINETAAIHMHVPLHFIGDDVSPGVKQGGIVSHQMIEVEITCLPKDLPEYIEIDLSTLGLNEAIHLSELEFPEGVELTSHSGDHDPTVTSIHMARVTEEEEEAEAAVPEEAAEGEQAEAPAGGGGDEGES